MRNRTIIALAAGLALLPGVADAQALVCRPPANPPAPRPDLASASEPKRVLPIGGYTLALTWNPGYCRAHGREASARFQCGGDARFGFTLHGLWPDGVGKQWPQYCARAAIVPSALLRETMCSTPSAQLVQHEWAKHGTCTGMDMRQYFGKARALYGAIRFPDMDVLSRRPLTVGRFKAALAGAHPGIPASAIRVTTTRQNWLDELWFCLDTRLRYARCKPGTGGAPNKAALRIGAGGASAAAGRSSRSTGGAGRDAS